MALCPYLWIDQELEGIHGLLGGSSLCSLLSLGEKGSWEAQASRLPNSLDNGKDAFLTVIVRLVLNRSSECSEEAVKELDEAPDSLLSRECA